MRAKEFYKNQKLSQNDDEWDGLETFSKKYLFAFAEQYAKHQNNELLEALKLSRENKGLLTEAEGVFDSIKVSDNIKRKVDDKFNDLDQKTEEK